jgi:hypothetical protein
MTDVFVAQGIPRQQAAALAEQNADSMFSTDVGGMTPEQQRQFAEQNQAIDDFEQRQKPQPPNNRWPPAQTFARYGRTIQKPAVTFNGEYEQNGEELKITIRSPGYYQFKGFTKAEITAICRVFEAEFGSTYPVGTYNDGKNWRDDVIDGRAAHGIEKSDPKHKNTAAMLYWIELDIQPQNSGDQILGLIIVIRPASGRPGGAA